MPRLALMLRSPRARPLLAAGLFIASVALNAWTMQRALRIDPIESPVVTAPLGTPEELEAALHDVVGTYTTGTRPGDRVIYVEPDGRIEFAEIGAAAPPPLADTYRLGRDGKTLYIVTSASGAVEVASLDTLVYYGDRYLRTHAVPQPSDATSPVSGQRRPRVAQL